VEIHFFWEVASIVSKIEFRVVLSCEDFSIRLAEISGHLENYSCISPPQPVIQFLGSHVHERISGQEARHIDNWVLHLIIVIGELDGYFLLWQRRVSKQDLYETFAHSWVTTSILQAKWSDDAITVRRLEQDSKGSHPIRFIWDNCCATLVVVANASLSVFKEREGQEEGDSKGRWCWGKGKT